MAAPSQTSYNSSTGNGVTTVFPYTFKILQAADIQVLVDGVEQTLTTHYTVSGVGVDAGGNVTFVTAPANGATVVRRRDMVIERVGTDYQYQGDIPADVLNQDQDAPILMLQQMQEQIGRTLRLPAGETAAEFGAASARKNLVPMFNTTTGALELSDFTATQIRDMIANGYGSGSLGVSGYIATLLDDADAAAARTTLGAGATGSTLFTAANAAAGRSTLSAAQSGANSDITSLAGLTTPISLVVLRNYIAGLTLSTAGASATFTTAAGVAIDSGNAYPMSLSASLSKTTSNWTVGAAGGGKARAAAIAINTWYHVFLMRRPDTGVVDVCFSPSITSLAGADYVASGGNIPDAYTQSRRIGSIRTDGSSQWVKFTQWGDQFLWDSPVLDVDITNEPTSEVLRTLTVPTGVKVLAFMNAYQNPTGASAAVYFSDPDVLNMASSTSVAPLGSMGNFGTVTPGLWQVQCSTNTSAQIRTRHSSGSASNNFRIATYGWLDLRGSNA